MKVTIIASCLLILFFRLCRGRKAPADYNDIADLVMSTLIRDGGVMKGQAWNRLANFTDSIGNRLSGSTNLKEAINYMITALNEEKLENVLGEEVMVPHWFRGREECTMLSPRDSYKVNILGLGTSVGTTGDSVLIADVSVVADFEELDRLGLQGLLQGKIVLMNPFCDWEAFPIECYGKLTVYRSQGASRASTYGAAAYLLRSLASKSIGSPHAGMQAYKEGVKPIPAAAISTEDADAMARMFKRGQNITLSLYMEDKNLPPEVSHNVVAEILGSERPEDIIVVSGHLDSWDVGVGAMDDGGGAFVSWQALSVLKYLGLRAKRTIRLVLWTSEEFGGIGAQAYYQRHATNSSEKHILLMESDMGVFRPSGLAFSGVKEKTGLLKYPSAQIMQQVLALLEPINASTLYVDDGGYETDTSPWKKAGVPGAALISDNQDYFAYHHSVGDQMKVLQPQDMDLAAVVFAVTAFVVADLDDDEEALTSSKKKTFAGGSSQIIPTPIPIAESKTFLRRH